MLKSSHSKKGQWFIISAVIISSSFLLISFLLKSYFFMDSSQVSKVNEDYYFSDIVDQLNSIALECNNESWSEFVNITKKETWKMGYLVDIRPEAECTDDFFVNVSSHRMNVCKSSSAITCAV